MCGIAPVASAQLLGLKPPDGRRAQIVRSTLASLPAGRNDDDPYGYSSIPPYGRGTDTPTRYDSQSHFVSGRITGGTGAFGRKLHVRLDDAEDRTIEAPRNVLVRRNARPISVHELRRGEAVRIRVARYSPEGDLVAVRIEVYEGASRTPRAEAGRETTVQGNVSSIDSHANILRIDSGGKRIIVHTEHAVIRNAEGAIGLRDLQNTDTVMVDGRRVADEVFAQSVVVQ